MSIKQSTLTDQSLATPVGAIELFPAVNAPAGWFICDGSSVSRTKYSALFKTIGTTYGFDDSDTFKTPDMRGRTPFGFASSGGHADVSTLGNNDGVALVNRRPSHNHTNTVSATHTLAMPNHSHSSSESAHSHSVVVYGGDDAHYSGASGSFGSISGGGSQTTSGPSSLPSDTNSSGSGTSVPGTITSGGLIGNSSNDSTNSSPYLVINYMIKY
jgi:hypothetical protein